MSCCPELSLPILFQTKTLFSKKKPTQNQNKKSVTAFDMADLCLLTHLFFIHTFHFMDCKRHILIKDLVAIFKKKSLNHVVKIWSRCLRFYKSLGFSESSDLNKITGS